MDGDDVEPRHRVYENQPGMPELLCREDGEPAPGDGYAGVRERVCGNVAPRAAVGTTGMEEAAPDIYREHGGSVSR